MRFLFAQGVWQQPVLHTEIWNDMKKQNQLRQTKSRRTVATSPRCFKKPNYKATSISAPRAKAALNAKDGHIKCWFNKSELMNKIYLWHYFWKHPHFTSFLHKCLKLNNTVGFLKHLGDVATVLLDLVCLPFFCFFMSFQMDWMKVRSDL